MAGSEAAVIEENKAALKKATLALSAVLHATYVSDSTTRTSLMNRIGLQITNTVRTLSHGHGGGETYELYNPRRTHQASAPGESFATDIGILSASYNWKVGKDEKGRTYVDVGTADERGPYLEFGTSNMEARPTLRPAVEMERDKVTAGAREYFATKLAAEVAAHGGH